MSTIILILGCQVEPVNVDNVVKAPDWIMQDEFKEFPEDKYYVAVGVSDRSFADARSRAFDEIIKKSCWRFTDIMYPSELHPSNDCFSKIRNSLPLDFFGNVENKQQIEFRRLLSEEFNNTLFGVLLEQTSNEAKSSKYPSWVEFCTVEQKRYTNGFTFYILITFDIEQALYDPAQILLDLYLESKDAENNNFSAFLENLYANIQLIQKKYFKGLYLLEKKGRKYEKTQCKSDIDYVLKQLNEYEEKLHTLYTDLEVKFSRNNVKGWRDKFTEK
ncbi:MAG: hypothetical protein K8S87_05960, partial [Planctomycetes bacterium]|nr:hypothetical protein [Planctomycetota bacterium]